MTSASDLPLTAEDEDTYRIIASGGDPGDRPVERLVSLGLVSPSAYQSDTWIPHDPRGVASRLRAQHQKDLSRAVDQMGHLPALEALHLHFDPHRWYGGPGSEFLGSPAEMNARVGEVVGNASQELCTAQPSAPDERDPAIVRQGVARNVGALARGAEVMTLYTALAYGDEQTRASVEEISAAGGQVRISAEPFQRMIIVDGEHLFIDNLVVDGAETHSGWHVSDRAAVAVARQTFQLVWDRSTRWHDLRPAPASGLTERQEAILRSLEMGDSQEQVSARTKLGRRTVAKELAAVKVALGARSVPQIMAWWGQRQRRD
ncbi:hypothetical protein [Streptomyces odonnellii]|uniref:hypothetical protein n=1 Tax=Streptomyces odonnellii TaxID=1417980 RepID=UPI00062633D5|nr:hypothetical protein [Streptomyces odonnellii]